MRNPLKNIGPGALVAAAFIGPGTVTVCTLAGVQFGYELLWAMTLSIIATLVLQEAAVRIGLVTQKGLSQVLREELSGYSRNMMILLVLAAIVLGNAAYEAGNISGGVLGIQALGIDGVYTLGNLSFNIWSILIGLVAFILLWLGNYKMIERLLIFLVLFMSLSFVITAILTKPDIGALLKNSFVPSFPSDSLLMIVALVGTTVVPYNLFLHASLVNQKWSGVDDIPVARKDTIIAVILGGLVSICVIIAASAIPSNQVEGAEGLVKSIAPLYGTAAKYFIALGLFAAGITSAITAPLAAAYVAQGCLNFKGGLKSKKFRASWMLVLILGVIFSTFGIKPIEIIKFAQVANGILLPIIAGILIWLVNRSQLMGAHLNGRFKNALSILILIITIILGLRSILRVTGII